MKPSFVRLSPEEDDTVDAIRRTLKPIPSKAETVRILVRRGAKAIAEENKARK
jgi:hypothetical protein